MHLTIQNTDASRGSAIVKDEQENKLFIIKGKKKSLSPTKKKFILDMSGNKLLKIRNRRLNFLFSGVILKDDQGNKMKLKTKLSFKKVCVLLGAGVDYKITRNPEGHGFAIYKNQAIIATFNKFGSGSINDRYNIDYHNPADLRMVVAIVAAFENIRDKDKQDISNV